MKVFLVGGAVRDQLMGRSVSDRDFVVVGSTPDEMLAAGFDQVGSDFPVFLHPQTHEEYALARTERKTGAGYHGFAVHFAPDVTLDEDLGRRDLTINAMAQLDSGEIVDPYNGQGDLRNRVLRHVRAESFIEDPVRVLRLARFAARYANFSIADETIELCRQMAANGEMGHLVAERVWSEISRGLMEDKPSRMFEVLRECHALQILLPELDRLWGVPQPAAHHPEVDTGVHVMMALDEAATAQAVLEVRFAVLMHDLGKGVTPADVLPSHPTHESLGEPLVREVSSRLRVPSHMAAMALLMCIEHTRVHRAMELKATSIVQLLGRTDFYRRPERLDWLIQACEFDARGRLGLATRPYPQANRIRTAAKAAKSVNAGVIAKACADASQIPERIYVARVSAVKQALA